MDVIVMEAQINITWLVEIGRDFVLGHATVVEETRHKLLDPSAVLLLEPIKSIFVAINVKDASSSSEGDAATTIIFGKAGLLGDS
jgi:hypothetical protein